MSQIKKVTTKGFKAEDRSYDLGRLNFLRGPVGKGKSQVGDAIQFAALGCVPRIGKNEAATGKLMSAIAMEVAATLDDGRLFEQALTREGRSLKGSASASWMPIGTKATEAADTIQGLFGASAEEAQQNLDVMRLLSLSGAKLAEAIEVLLDAGGLSIEERVEKAVALWNNRLDAMRETIDGLRQPIPPAVRAGMNEQLEEFRAQVEASLVKAIAWVGAEKRKAANDASEYVKARAALENRMNELRAPAESAEQLKARKLEAERRKTELTTQIEMAENAGKERTQAAEEVVHAHDAVVSAELELQTLKEKDIDPAAMREAAEAIVDPDPVEPFTAETVDESQWEEARAEIARIRADLDAIQFSEAPKKPAYAKCPAMVDCSSEWLEVHAAERRLQEAEDGDWQVVLEALAGLLAMNYSCPTGTLETDPDFKRLQELAQENAPDLETLKADLEAKTKSHNDKAALRDAAVEEHDRITAANDALEEEYDQAVEKWQEVENQKTERRTELKSQIKAIEDRISAERSAKGSEVDERNRAGMKAYEERRDARALTVKENTAERTRLRNKAQKHEDEVRDAADALKTAQGSLETARSRVQGITDAVPVDIESAKAEIEELKDSITRTKDALALCEQASALATEMQTLITRIDRATANQSVFSAAEWALKRLRDEDMALRSQGLEGQMTRFLAAAGRPETPYLRCSKGAAEFGWRTPGGSEVDVAVLSGGQAIFFKAALAFAVIMARNPQIKILLLELAEAADGEVAEAILQACEAVCKDVQVIVASCAPVQIPSEAWNIIDLEQTQEIGA